MVKRLKEMKWSARLHNRTFWVSLMSALILLTQQLGVEIFPENIMEIVNTLLSIAVILGVIVDPTTPTIYDN